MSRLKNIVLIGGRGVVGSSIYKYLNLNYKINICSRNDKFDKFLDNAEIIIHTANSSKKFEAIKNPNRDFKESILKFETPNLIPTKAVILFFRS